MGNINCPVLGVKSGGVDSVIRSMNEIQQGNDFPDDQNVNNENVVETVSVIVT